jgi:hypothetical protein
MNDPTPSLPSAAAPIGARPRRPWITVLLCALIFLGGGVTGASVAVLHVGHRAKEAIEHPDLLPQRIAHRLKGRLELTDDQTRRVEQIVRRRYQRILSARDNLLQNIGPEFDAIEREILPLLAPEQAGRLKERFQSFREECLPRRVVQ